MGVIYVEKVLHVKVASYDASFRIQKSAVINNYKLSEIGSTDLPEMGLKLCKRRTVIFLDS